MTEDQEKKLSGKMRAAFRRRRLQEDQEQRDEEERADRKQRNQNSLHGDKDKGDHLRRAKPEHSGLPPEPDASEESVIGNDTGGSFSFKISRSLLHDPRRRKELNRRLDALIKSAVKDHGFDVVFIYKGDGKTIDPLITQLIQGRICFLLSGSRDAGKALSRMGFEQADIQKLSHVTVSQAPQGDPPGGVLKRTARSVKDRFSSPSPP